ncbi:MAG: hypothetical protein AAF360_10030 [Pseudomonadota bacterium]
MSAGLAEGLNETLIVCQIGDEDPKFCAMRPDDARATGQRLIRLAAMAQGGGAA